MAHVLFMNNYITFYSFCLIMIIAFRKIAQESFFRLYPYITFLYPSLTPNIIRPLKDGVSKKKIAGESKTRYRYRLIHIKMNILPQSKDRCL